MLGRDLKESPRPREKSRNKKKKKEKSSDSSSELRKDLSSDSLSEPSPKDAEERDTKVKLPATETTDFTAKSNKNLAPVHLPVEASGTDEVPLFDPIEALLREQEKVMFDKVHLQTPERSTESGETNEREKESIEPSEDGEDEGEKSGDAVTKKKYSVRRTSRTGSPGAPKKNSRQGSLSSLPLIAEGAVPENVQESSADPLQKVKKVSISPLRTSAIFFFIAVYSWSRTHCVAEWLQTRLKTFFQAWAFIVLVIISKEGRSERGGNGTSQVTTRD